MTLIQVLIIDRVELLTASRLCGVVFDDHNFKFSASAKVSVKSNGQEMLGYVLSCSTNNKMKVYISDNIIIGCYCPK